MAHLSFVKGNLAYSRWCVFFNNKYDI